MGKAASRFQRRRPIKGVAGLLDSPEWQSLNSASQPIKGGVLRKLELIDEASLPPMQVLAATRLEELQRFPANQEGHTLDAREALKPGSHAVIMLVSHRWLRPNDGEIDDEDRSKLKALLEFVRWYRLKYPAREIYFWIDFCCIAWNNRSLGIAALPAYVAAATDMLCYETADYGERAWCRLERAVAYSFMFSGAVPWVIRPGFTSTDPPQPVQSREVPLLDPLEGAVTVLSDMEHITMLLKIAQRSRASEAWGMSRSLKFGEGGTKITASEPGQPRIERDN